MDVSRSRLDAAQLPPTAELLNSPRREQGSPAELPPPSASPRPRDPLQAVPPPPQAVQSSAPIRSRTALGTSAAVAAAGLGAYIATTGLLRFLDWGGNALSPEIHGRAAGADNGFGDALRVLLPLAAMTVTYLNRPSRAGS